MTWDWIVAGAGHNGLTAGCYLAKAGERVLALDQDSTYGGGASTREVTLPGFKHNLHAMRILPWRLVYDDLELQRHGVEFIWQDSYAANIFSDGRALVRYVDLDRAVAEIARFSERDARTYRDLYMQTREIRKRAQQRRLGWVQPSGGQPPIDPANPFSATLARWYWMSQISVLRELFESEEVRVSLRGSLQTVSYPGDIPLTGLNVTTGMLAFHDGPSAIIRGGTWQYARGLAEVLLENGGAIEVNARVREILTEAGRAVGVKLEDGREFRATKGVIAGFGHKVLLDTVDHALLAPDYIEGVQRFRGEELVIFAVHAAIDRPVSYRASADNPDVDRCLDVTWGLETTMDLVRSYNDGREHRLPRDLSGFCDTPSAWDPSYAPDGQSSVDIGVIVPWSLYPDSGPGGHRPGKGERPSPDHWDAVKADLGERALDAWLGHTNLTRANVLHSYVYSPLDIVRSNPSFFEGSPVQGSGLPDQAGVFRPTYGWSEYASPVEGLYVASGSAYPLGGLNGIPGHHCATRIARDYNLPRWWSPTPGFDA